MAVESEVKVCVESFDKVKDALLLANAKHISTVCEKNVLYDSKGGGLKDEDVGLRIRYEKDASGALERVLLTIKGPRIGGATKKRHEFEVAVSSFRKAKEVLSLLGFSEALVYEKVREIWVLSGVEVCLDTLPFGLYVEIEGKEKDIFSAAKKLGFHRDEFIAANYFDLAREKGIRGDIVF